MKKSLFYHGALALLLALSCVQGALAQPADAQLVALFGGEQNMEMVRHPSVVNVCRLQVMDEEAKGGANVITLHRINYKKGAWKSLTSKQAKQLQTELLTASKYDWKSISFCDPRYNYRFRFQAKGETLSIDYCVSCKELLISKNGKIVGDEDFDSSVFRQLLKRLFPGDRILQKAGK